MKKIWDKFTEDLGKTIIHPQYFLKKYSYTATKLTLKYATGTLIDIGCGRMLYKKTLLSTVDKYIGVDSPKTAKYYKSSEKPDISADATKIPLPPRSCNIVLLSQVIEHLPEPQKALKEANRLLKKDGVIIVSTVQNYPLHDEPYDFFRYTKYGLSYILKQSGFKIIDHKEEGNIFTTIGQNINVYIMLNLKRLIGNNVGIIVGFILAPFAVVLTTISNLLTLPLSFLDRGSKFNLIHTFVAKKSSSGFSTKKKEVRD